MHNKTEIAALLEMLESPDEDLKREGVMRAAMLLEELASPGSREVSFGGEVDAVVQDLRRLVNSSHFVSGMLWALGKARTTPAALETLLNFLDSDGLRIDDDACYQLLIAIENFPNDWNAFLPKSENVEPTCLNAKMTIECILNSERLSEKTKAVGGRILSRS